MDLAVVIPAYKITFLEEALESFNNQTNRNFKIYIGDDFSPNDLYPIVKKFSQNLDIEYKRFNKNLGGKNLVAHWHRCIKLVKNPKWIWLFSDDDIVDKNCVKKFYDELESNPTASLFHFDTCVIDKHSKKIHNDPLFKWLFIDAKDFLKKRMNFQLSTYAVEYIFHISLYEGINGFKVFPLAWNSDIATWYNAIEKGGIVCIEEVKVYWRYSSENISSSQEDNIQLGNKFLANLLFIKFILQLDLFSKKEIVLYTITILKSNINLLTISQLYRYTLMLKNLLQKNNFQLSSLMLPLRLWILYLLKKMIY